MSCRDWSPCLIRSADPSGEVRYDLGHPLVDRYLAFVAGRARRRRPQRKLIQGVQREDPNKGHDHTFFIQLSRDVVAD